MIKFNVPSLEQLTADGYGPRQTIKVIEECATIVKTIEEKILSGVPMGETLEQVKSSATDLGWTAFEKYSLTPALNQVDVICTECGNSAPQGQEIVHKDNCQLGNMKKDIESGDLGPIQADTSVSSLNDSSTELQANAAPLVTDQPVQEPVTSLETPVAPEVPPVPASELGGILEGMTHRGITQTITDFAHRMNISAGFTADEDMIVGKMEVTRDRVFRFLISPELVRVTFNPYPQEEPRVIYLESKKFQIHSMLDAIEKFIRMVK